MKLTDYAEVGKIRCPWRVTASHILHKGNLKEGILHEI